MKSPLQTDVFERASLAWGSAHGCRGASMKRAGRWDPTDTWHALKRQRLDDSSCFPHSHAAGGPVTDAAALVNAAQPFTARCAGGDGGGDRGEAPVLPSHVRSSPHSTSGATGKRNFPEMGNDSDAHGGTVEMVERRYKKNWGEIGTHGDEEVAGGRGDGAGAWDSGVGVIRAKRASDMRVDALRGCASDGVLATGKLARGEGGGCEGAGARQASREGGGRIRGETSVAHQVHEDASDAASLMFSDFNYWRLPYGGSSFSGAGMLDDVEGAEWSRSSMMGDRDRYPPLGGSMKRTAGREGGGEWCMERGKRPRWL
ncbi:hypothetical protein CLOM_g12525 [Closterium sp. NIES-68]|nr:hypothetical protein CLOM_g12525 [Closterium sp. NIES-68]GJP74998.1 hypothetical protein CLOP_g5496 [Closterium sp. NIES-67]